MFRRKADVVLVAHWYRLIEGLNHPPSEFYRRLVAALARREVPALAAEEVYLSEGGLLSAKREYLRLRRERLCFDICGAPFGTGYFVSWRLGERPLRISWLALVILLGVLAWVAMVIATVVAPQLAAVMRDVANLRVGAAGAAYLYTVALVGCFVLLFYGVRFSLGVFLRNVDAGMMRIPVLGPLYERFFRAVTYYRIDVTLMYQEAVHAAVLEVIDELTRGAGLPAIPDVERKPIVRGLYAR